MLLEDARQEINQIDEKMAELFERRMKAVEQIIAYKLQNNMPVLDSSREQLVILKNLAYIKNDTYKPYYEDFIKYTMELSKQYQRKLSNGQTVGFQGTEGAFSHIALKRIFKQVNTKAYATFEDVFKGVMSDEIACGIIPFENSFTGEVGEVLDMLYKYDCYINEIYDLKINHNLLGIKGTKLSDIKQVYSHHQALSQCGEFFNQYHYELVPYPNTALAAKYVSECGDTSKVAVASIETAEIYGLDVLVKDINTSAENTTRFIIISKELKSTGNRYNLLFTLEHSAGELANVMQIIGSYGFNMESIKSKSLHNVPWQYYFYVELVGDIKSDNSQKMLATLKENCKELNLL
ncbi:MAG: chorismate mutase, partial [Oscillospiraceae bacterium]